MSAVVTDAELVSMFARCVGFDPDGATGGELDAHAVVLGRVGSWIDAQRARVGAARRRLEDAATEAAGRVGGSAKRPRRRGRPVPGPGGGSGAASRRDADAAEGARRCASFADALAEGKLSADHLVAVGRARNAVDTTAEESVLLEAALARSADEFGRWLRAWDDACDLARGEDVAARRHAKRKVIFGVDEDGMQTTRAVLGPVEHAAVSQALHDAADRLWRNGDRASSTAQRLADALVGLVTGRIGTAAPVPTPASAPASADPTATEADDPADTDDPAEGGRVGEPTAAAAAPPASSPAAAPATVPKRPPGSTILAILDEAWMRGEADKIGVATTLDGVPLTPTELRIALCDAEILPVVLGGQGQIVDFGRARRDATDGQWRALLARDGGCAVLGCPAGAHQCVAHHCRPWELGGATDLDNLCLLCAHHHRQLHLLGWTAFVEQGVVRITTVAGHEIPTRDHRGPVPARTNVRAA